jgi:hypothetical protein
MLPGLAARGTRVTSRTEAADRLKQCPLARSNNTLDMDCRYPYGRGATVDKNREIAGSKTRRSQGMLENAASRTARVWGPLNVRHELYRMRMRVTTKNPMIGIARKIRIARSRVGGCAWIPPCGAAKAGRRPNSGLCAMIAS